MSSGEGWRAQRESFTKSNPEFVISVRKQYIVDQQATSVLKSAGCDDSRILYADAFLSRKIVLHSKDTSISAYPATIAEAFMAKNLTECTKILSSDIFTKLESEISAQMRDIDLNPIKYLPARKVQAIKNAALWMKNKHKDPYSYTPPITNYVYTVQESIEFETAFASFQTISQPNVELCSEYPKSQDKTACRKIENAWFIQHFNEYMDDVQDGKMPSLGHAAQAARELTIITILYLIDTVISCVFVDHVQFSKDRIKKARKTFTERKDVTATADVLFRSFYRRDFADKKKCFTSFKDLASDKRLAIFRAVAWLRSSTCTDTPEEEFFDSNLAIYNGYPTEEDIEKIVQFLETTYGTNPYIEGTSEEGVTIPVEQIQAEFEEIIATLPPDNDVGVAMEVENLTFEAQTGQMNMETTESIHNGLQAIPNNTINTTVNENLMEGITFSLVIDNNNTSQESPANLLTENSTFEPPVPFTVETLNEAKAKFNLFRAKKNVRITVGHFLFDKMFPTAAHRNWGLQTRNYEEKDANNKVIRRWTINMLPEETQNHFLDTLETVTESSFSDAERKHYRTQLLTYYRKNTRS